MKKEEDLLRRARTCLQCGVIAATRRNKYSGYPFIISKATECKLYDAAGTPYKDMSMSYGASLLGHGHPLVVDALAQSGALGIGCGMEFSEQVELAERIVKTVPSAEMVRFSFLGIETTQYAVKLARVHTEKRIIIKIEGHFHG